MSQHDTNLIPELPDDSVVPPTSSNPSPSMGLIKATKPDADTELRQKAEKIAFNHLPLNHVNHKAKLADDIMSLILADRKRTSDGLRSAVREFRVHIEKDHPIKEECAWEEDLMHLIDQYIVLQCAERERQISIRELGWCLRTPQKSIAARLDELTRQTAINTIREKE